MARKFWIPATSAVSAIAIAATAGVATALHKNDVTLVIDGEPVTIAVREDTVAEVLALEEIKLGAHDVVLPAPSTEVTDQMEISVSYGRPLELTVDGEDRTVWTTARTVDDALALLSLDEEGSKLSTSRSASISREGLELEVITPKDITITVAGKPAQVSVAGTVADALKEVGATPDADDKVTPAADTMLTDGMEVSFVAVEVKQVDKDVEIPFKKTSVKTSKLNKGTSKVTTKGVPGVKKETWTEVYEDGTLVSSELAGSEVTTEPVTQVTSVGTYVKPAPKPAAKPEPKKATSSTSGSSSSSSSSASSSSTSTSSSSGVGINLARASMWDSIAQCESSGNWSINTGNGYYGGLQFNLATWRSVDGQDFAAYPHQASRAEQITVANRLYAIRGLQPWSCKP